MKKIIIIFIAIAFLLVSCSTPTTSTPTSTTGTTVSTNSGTEGGSNGGNNSTPSNPTTTTATTPTNGGSTSGTTSSIPTTSETSTPSTQSQPTSSDPNTSTQPSTSTNGENTSSEPQTTSNNETTTLTPIVTHTVRFVDSIYGRLLTFSNVRHGETVEEPTPPSKTDYKFKGWYLNNNLFDFNTPINEDMSILGVYSNNVFTYNYEGDWGDRNNDGAYRFARLPVEIILHRTEIDPGRSITIPSSEVVFDGNGNAQVIGTISIYEQVYSHGWRDVLVTRRFKFNLHKSLITHVSTNGSHSSTYVDGFSVTATAEKNDNQYCTDYSFDVTSTWCGMSSENSSRPYGVNLVINIYLYR